MLLMEYSTKRCDGTYLVCLLSVLVFRLTLEPISSVHFFRLVISAIYEHLLWK